MTCETYLMTKGAGMAVGLAVSLTVVVLLLASNREGRYAIRALILDIIGR